jgi:multimeric flavodoxin WrbA
MKIVGICGSPRKGGNTEIIVREALRGAGRAGAQTELLHLGDLKIEFCDGCLVCDTTGRCHINDDMQVVYKKMQEADSLIIGSPTRFDNVSGQLKVFIDRTNPLCKDRKLKGKKVGLLTVGYWRDSISRERTLDILKNFCEIHEMKVIATMVGYEKSGRAGKIKKNKQTLKGCFDLGVKLVSSLQ